MIKWEMSQGVQCGHVPEIFGIETGESEKPLLPRTAFPELQVIYWKC